MAEAKGPSVAERLDKVEKVLIEATGPSVAERLERIEKVLGIGVEAEAVAAERSKRHDDLVKGKAARAEAERKRALKAAAA